MKEKEINLRDLIVEILLHWRSIIVLIIIVGIIAGAASYALSSKEAQAQAARIEELKGQLEEKLLERKQLEERWLKEQQKEAVDLTDEIQEYLQDDDFDLETAVLELLSDNGITLKEQQRNNVNYVLYYERSYQRILSDQEQSIITQMDPNKVQRAEVTILISSDDMERSCGLEKVYEEMAFSAELLEEMGRLAGVPTYCIEEVYSLSASSSGSLNGRDSFTVKISHYNRTMCQRLLQAVIDHIESKHAVLEELWGTHEVIVLNQAVSIVADRNILNAQKSVEKSLLDTEAAIYSTKAAFSNEEWYYYNLLTAGKLAGNPYEVPVRAEAPVTELEDIEAAINAGVTVTPGISIRTMLISMTLVAFVYVFLIFMKYILNTRIRPADRLDELYGIPQLGQIPKDSNGKRFLGLVDQWILALRYRGQRRFSKKEAMDLATISIKIAVKKENMNTVCLIGCGMKERALESCQHIRHTLAESAITTYILDNILYDAAAMEKLGDTEGVVLVESADSALYTEIARELELIQRQQIKVLGGIVVE